MTAPLLLAAISVVILVQVGIGIGIAFWRLQHRGAAPVPGQAEWGVPSSDIHSESFGPASSGYAKPGAVEIRAPLPKALDIQFRRSRRTVAWTGEDASLLDFADRHGISVESGCRSGSCGACKTRLVSGEVRYDSKPVFQMPSGACLLCIATPVSNLVLEA